MAKMTVKMYTPGKDMANQYFTIDMSDADSKETSLKICRRGAELLLEKLKAHLEETTHDANAAVRGTLANSLKITESSSGTCFVGPSGKHHGKGSGLKTKAAGYHRPKTGQGASSKRKHHGMTDAVSAVDVGYYLEYGTPRMDAEHWMETTLENSEEEILAAMEQAWDEHLKSLGL